MGAEETFGARIFIADGSGEHPSLMEVDTLDSELRRTQGSLLNGPKDLAFEVQKDLALSLDPSEGLADAVRRMARVLLWAREHTDRIGPRLRAAAVVQQNGRLVRPSWFDRAERLADISDEEILDAAQGVPGSPPGNYRREGTTRRIDTQAGQILSGMQVNSGVKGSDGSRTGPVNKVTERDAHSDGQSISYGENYQNVPLWRPSGGHKTVPAFYDPSTDDGAVPKIELLSAGPGGGTLKAVIEEVVSGTTTQTASFSADTHADVGVNDDDYSAEQGTVDAAWDDLYTFTFDITAFGGENCFDGECWCTGGSISVGAYINDGSGPELQDTYSKSADCANSTDFDAEMTVSFSTLPNGGHTGKEFWMGIESGENDGEYTAKTVEWETGGNPSTESATSDGSDNTAYPARWFAYAKEDG